MTNKVERLGATREEWDHFAHSLNLTEDLLPVVSNTAATISPDSKLVALGKVPSRYNTSRQAVGIKDWPQLRATARQIAMWREERDYGISIITRSVRALDLDLEDPAAVQRIRISIAQTIGGALPCRYRSGSARALLVFRLAGPVVKATVAHPSGMVELLADGQQFVAAGTHTSGHRYQWAGGLPVSIPTLTAQQLEEVWKQLGGAPAKRPRPARIGAAAGGSDAAAPGGGSSSDRVAQWLIEREWVVEEGEPLCIRCPWADEHTSVSGPTETVYWSAGTGGYEMGHFKCLHAHCAQRTDNDFLDGVGYRLADLGEFDEVVAEAATQAPQPADVPHETSGAVTVVSKPSDGWRSSEPGKGLTRGKKGYQAVLQNLTRALDTPGVWLRLGYDEFRMQLMVSPWGAGLEDAPWRPLTDDDLIGGRELLGKLGFEPVGREIMRDACEKVAKGRSFDSLQMWCGRLRWDGVDRICKFLQTYYGAADTPYVTAVNRYWWTGLAGRALSPGCQADMVPILIGPQGLRKTRGIESLAPWPDAYTTVNLASEDDKLARRMRGTCIQEISELRGLHTKEKEAIKSFVTERRDKWIPKFQEFAVWSPRRGLFIGTGNESEVLDDETGNRRWLPVEVAKFGELTAKVRDQLWAQGVCEFLCDGIAWAQAEQLARREHEGFRIADSWETDLTRWASARADPDAPFTLRDAAIGIGLYPSEINRPLENRIGKALRAIGAIRMARKRDDGNWLRHWKIR